MPTNNKHGNNTVSPLPTTAAASALPAQPSRLVPGNRLAVNLNQVTSLNALIAYVARRSGTSEFAIERKLADRFSVSNMKCLPTAQFENAVRYLVDVLDA